MAQLFMQKCCLRRIVALFNSCSVHRPKLRCKACMDNRYLVISFFCIYLSQIGRARVRLSWGRSPLARRPTGDVSATPAAAPAPPQYTAPQVAATVCHAITVSSFVRSPTVIIILIINNNMLLYSNNK